MTFSFLPANDVFEYYRVGIITAPTASVFGEDFSTEAIAIADRCGLGTSKVVSMSRMDTTKYLFVITGNENNITRCTYNMILNLRNRYAVDFSISLSTPKTDMESFTDAICEAMKVVDKHVGDAPEPLPQLAEKRAADARKGALPKYFSTVTYYSGLMTEAVNDTEEPGSIKAAAEQLFDFLKRQAVDYVLARDICFDIFTCSASELLRLFRENVMIVECIDRESMNGLPDSGYISKLKDDFIARYERIQRVLRTYFSASAPVASTIMETLDYLLETQCAKVTLQYMADYVNVSSSYLSSSFKKKTGVSFRDYVRRYKMEQAKFQLSHSRRTIRQIALELGYNDIVNFSRSFKKDFGMSPSEYRNSHSEW